MGKRKGGNKAREENIKKPSAVEFQWVFPTRNIFSIGLLDKEIMEVNVNHFSVL
jgi:hypothetical protein